MSVIGRGQSLPSWPLILLKSRERIFFFIVMTISSKIIPSALRRDNSVNAEGIILPLKLEVF